MKSLMKRIVALVVAVALMSGFCCVPAMAQTNNSMDLSFIFTNTDFEEIETAKVGDTVYLGLKLNNYIPLSGYTWKFTYDSECLEFNSKYKYGRIFFGGIYELLEFEASVHNTDDAGVVVSSGAAAENIQKDSLLENGCLVYYAFDVIGSGTAAVQYDTQNTDQFEWLTIDENDTPIATTLTSGSLKCVAPGVSLSTASVTVDGTNGASVTAVAIANDGSDVSSSESWTIDAAADSGVSISGNTITVSPKAKAGTYTVSCSAGEAQLEVKRAASVNSDLEIVGAPSGSVDRPYAGETDTEELSVQVFDQYGDDVTDESMEIDWSVSPSGKGVTVADGVVTITAAADAGTYTVTAGLGSLSDSVQIAVASEASAAKSVTILKDGSPIDSDTLTMGSDSTYFSSSYTAEVTDQYGEEITTGTVWSLDGVSNADIQLENGKLTIRNTVPHNTTFSVVAENGSASDSVTVTFINPWDMTITDPTDAKQTYAPDGSVTLTAGAVPAAAGSISYQWYRAEDKNGGSASAIAGATDATYTVEAPDAGTYYYFCRVTHTYEGKGYVVDTAVATVTIDRAKLTGSMVDVTAGYDYTGSTISCDYTVMNGTVELVKGTDYTVSGDSGVDSKEYTLTITGKGNYEGTVQKSWTVSPAGLMLTEGQRNYSVTLYMGEHSGTTPKTLSLPTLVAVDGSKVSVDYAVTSGGDVIDFTESGVKVEALKLGNAVITATYSADNHEDTVVTYTVNVIEKTDVSNAITFAAREGISVTYDGVARYLTKFVDPASCTAGGGTITYKQVKADGTYEDLPDGLGTQYTNAGTYTVVAVYADEQQEGVSQPVTFVISKKNVPIPVANSGLTFDALTQIGVEQGDFYTLSGTVSAVNAGAYTAVAKLDDAANYQWSDGSSDEKEIKWSIAPKTVTADVTLSQDSFEYDGAAKTPAVTAKDGGATIIAGEYTVSYENNVNAGTATVKLTDKDGGNYVVSGSKTFTITPKAVTAEVILTQDSFEYDGTAKTPGVTAKDNGTIIPASEYTVSYEGNTDAGTATVTLTDKDGGNYVVSGSETFVITPKEVSVVWSADLTYTGVKQLPTASVKDVNGDPLALTVEVAEGGVNAGEHSAAAAFAAVQKNYTLTNTSYTYTINQAPVTVGSVTIDTRDYDGTFNAPVAAVEIVGLQNGESLAMGTDYTVTGIYGNADAAQNKTAAGTVTLKNTGKAANYVLSDGTYTAAGTVEAVEITDPAQLDTSAVSVSKTYDGTNAAGTVSGKVKVTGLVGSETLLVSVSSVSGYPAAAADDGYTVTLTLGALENNGDAKASNYELKIGAVQFDKAEIKPAGYTYSVTAAQDVKEGGGLDQLTAPAVANGVNGETLTGSVKWYTDANCTAEASDPDLSGLSAGSAKTLYWKFTPDSNTNYDVTAKIGSVAVTIVEGAPQSASFAQTAVSKTYGDSAFTNALTVMSGQSNITSAAADRITYSSSDPAVATVDSKTGEVTVLKPGSTTIKAEVAKVAGEYAAGSASYVLTVEKATLIPDTTGITVDKTYDATTNAGEISGAVSFTGKVGGDDVAVQAVAGKYADAASGSKTVTLTLSLTGAKADWYQLSTTTAEVSGTISAAAQFTDSTNKAQNVVVGVGSFAAPVFTGINGEAVTGTLTYTYGGQTKTQAEIVTALKALTKGDKADIGYSFAASGNYSGSKTGTIIVTMVDILFQIGGTDATAGNAMSIKADPTYGDNWGAIASVKDGIEASVDGFAVPGSFKLYNDAGELISADLPAAGTHEVTLKFYAAEGDRYQGVEVCSTTITVAAKSVPAVWSNTALTYNGKEQKPTATADTGIAGETLTVTVTGAKKDAGSYTAEASISNGNYELTNNSVSFRIAPKSAAAVWSNTALTYNGEQQSPTATADTEIAGETLIVTVSGAQKNAGSYEATASIDNGNYTLTNGSSDFVIAPKNVNVSWSNTALTYNGKEQKPAAAADTGIAGETLTVTVTGEKKDAGEYTAKASIDNKNYKLIGDETSFKIAPKDVTVEWSNTALTYNGKDQKPSASATTGIAGETLTVTVAGAKKDVGSYTASASISNGNYTLTNASTSFKIDPKSVDVVWSNTALTYNGKIQSPTANVDTGIEGNILVTVTGAGKSVGNYTAIASIDNKNYSLTNISTPFTIGQAAAPALTVDGTVTYKYTAAGGKTVTITGVPADCGTVAYSVGAVTGQTSILDGTPSISDNGVLSFVLAADASDVDKTVTIPVTVSMENYKTAFVNVVIAIKAKDIPTVTAKDITVEYSGKALGADAIEGTATFGGQTVTGSWIWITDPATLINAGSKTAQVKFVPADIANYAEVTDDITVKVTPKSVAVEWSNTALTYNGAEQQPAASADTGIAGETLTVTVTGAKKDAGSYTASASISNGNYTLTNAAVDFVIAPKGVNVSWSSTALTYNGKDQKPSAAADTGIAGETLTVTVTGEKKDAGEYTAKASIDNKNYKLIGDETSFKIAPKDVTVEWSNTALTYNGKDQKPSASATTGIAGETLSISVGGAKKDAGEYTAAATTGNGNYALNNASTSFKIAPKSVAVEWSNTALTYNGKDQKPSASADTGIAGETLTVTVSGAGKNVGEYTAAASASNENYSLTNTTAPFTIGQAAAPALSVEGTTTFKYSVSGSKTVTIKGVPADAGTVDYVIGTVTGQTSILGGTPAVDDATGVVTFVLAADAADAEKTVTIPVSVSMDNYKTAAVNVVIAIDAKEVPEADAQDITVDYTGIALGADAIEGTATFGGQTVAGNWEWVTDPAALINAGTHTAQVRFLPTDSTNYAEVTVDITVTVKTIKVTVPAAVTGLVYNTQEQTGVADGEFYSVADGSAVNGGIYTAVVTLDDAVNYEWATEFDGTIQWSIAKADITGQPGYTAIRSSGKTLADAALNNGTISVAGSVIWVDENGDELPAGTEVKANTNYQWVFVPTESSNYNGLSGAIRLYRRSSSDSSVQTGTTVTENSDGSTTTVIVDQNGSKGETTVSEDGTVKAQVALDAGTAAQAAKDDTPVVLPVPALPVTDNADEASVIEIDTNSSKPVQVEIPLKDGDAGTVAVVIDEDGNRKVIRDSVADEDSIIVTVSDGDTVMVINNGKTFSDVPASHWAYNAVSFVSGRELFSGVGDGKFAPGLATNRAMIAQVLHSLKYKPEPATENPFVDVADNAWYEKAVTWAAENGVVAGYGNGIFGPDINITREQLVVMLWSYAGRSKASDDRYAGTFKDGEDISFWAVDGMNWALENKLISGKGNGILDPIGLATRAEVAQIMKNFIEYLTK